MHWTNGLPFSMLIITLGEKIVYLSGETNLPEAKNELVSTSTKIKCCRPNRTTSIKGFGN